jgi:hypothetical protein
MKQSRPESPEIKKSRPASPEQIREPTSPFMIPSIPSTPSSPVKLLPPVKTQLPEGAIYLTVHKAKDLEKKGIIGKADPYVVIGYGDKVFKSKTVDNNHNPEWNFDVKLDIKKDSPHEVTLDIFDEDFGKDDSMGQKQIDIVNMLTERTVKNRWIVLKDCKSGQVLISAEYVPAGETIATADIDETLQRLPQESESVEKISSEKQEARPTLPEKTITRPTSQEN